MQAQPRALHPHLPADGWWTRAMASAACQVRDAAINSLTNQCTRPMRTFRMPRKITL